jgi:hypothetical protein
MNIRRLTTAATIAAIIITAATSANAAQLSPDAKSAIPHDVQQLIAIDYRAMENSPVAMSMKDRLMQPELKTFESALRNSGLDVSKDVDVLAFAAFRSKATSTNASVAASTADSTHTLGIAQGQFATRAIQANFVKKQIKPIVVRGTSIYPMGSSGLQVAFLNQTTMIFGEKSAVMAAVDTRDSLQPSILTNSGLMDSMAAVDSDAIWSLLDAKGSQVVLRSLLGEAAGLTDFQTVKDRLQGARYTMEFSNGVRFKMDVLTGDPITAAAMSTLLQGAVIYKKSSGTDVEKAALNSTTVNSSGDILTAQYASSDSQFSNLLNSNLFQSVVK